MIRENIINEMLATRCPKAAAVVREFANGFSTDDLTAMAREGKMSRDELVDMILEDGFDYTDFYVYAYPSGGYEFLTYMIEDPWEFGNPVLVFDYRRFSDLYSDNRDTEYMRGQIEDAIESALFVAAFEFNPFRTPCI